MKKKLVMLFTVILLVSVFVTAYPVLTGGDDDALRCEVFFELNWTWEGFAEEPGYPWGLTIVDEEYTWIGTVSGDIEGEFTITLIGAYLEYEPFEVYWEEWVIETDEGTITVLQAGVWSFETFKALSNGPVVDATGEWEYLIGSTMYVSGVTTEFPVDPPTPVTGVGEMWIDFEDD